jgi:5-formyltetrahydrofolate cyclo-ligase family
MSAGRQPGARGAWNIPVPAKGEEVRTDIALAPLVGYDARCYRLGYGGGYFDRTLAQLPASTIAIGVGYAETEIATIYPQPFDIPMRRIVTERSVSRPPVGADPRWQNGARRSVPSPLVGEGQGGGESQTSNIGVPPIPSPSPQGGGGSVQRLACRASWSVSS